MPWVDADTEVKILINAAVQNNPRYNITLSGDDHGFQGLEVALNKIMAERGGFYPGVVKTDDTKRYEATEYTFEVLAGDTMKALIGKAGQYMHLQIVHRAGATVKVTTKLVLLILNECIPRPNGDGILAINPRVKLYDFTAPVVA